MSVADFIVHNLWVVFDYVSQRPTDWPFIFFLPVLIGIAMADREPFWTYLSTYVKPIVLIASVLTLLAVFRIGVCYLSMNFINNSNATLYAINSWLFCLGQPLYSGIDAKEPYAEPYGPYGYMLVAVFQYALGPSVFSSKLAPFLTTFGSWIFLYLAIRNRAGWLSALALTALAGALDLPFEPLQFWPRPDPFLLLAVTGGLWASTRREVWGPILLGVFIGFAVSLKVYAVVFFPLALAEAWRNHKFLRRWMLALLVIVVTALLPYAWPNISIENYLLDLKVNSSAPFQIVFGIQYVEWGVVLFMIGLSSLFINKVETDKTISTIRRNFDLLFFFFLSFIAVSYVACKVGPHHVMPFIPIAVYLTARLHADISSKPFLQQTYRWGGLSLVLSIVLFAELLALLASIKEPRIFAYRDTLAREEIVDIGLIFNEKMPCVLLNAAGSQFTHEDDFYRAILVFNGMPLGLDPAAAMDYRFFDRREPNLPVLVAELKSKYHERLVWICPKGTVPFSLTSYYVPNERVFSDQFVSDFHHYFQLSGHSTYFDLYEEKPN